MSRRSNLVQIAEDMLADQSLEDILEQNDLTEQDVLELLLAKGLVDYRVYDRRPIDTED